MKSPSVGVPRSSTPGFRAPRARASSAPSVDGAQQVGGAAEVERRSPRRAGDRRSRRGGVPAPSRSPRRPRGAAPASRGPGRRSDRPRCPRGPSSRGSAGPARPSSGGTPSRPACSSAAPAACDPDRSAASMARSTLVDHDLVDQAGHLDHVDRRRRGRGRPGPRRGARRPGRQHPTRGRDRAGRWLVCARGASEGDRGSDAVLRRLPAASIVAGKGGVGKTTVTAALATAAGGAGLRVLVVEVEGKSGLGQMLGGRRRAGLRGGGGAAPGSGRTARARSAARTLTPDNALFEYLDEHGLRRLSQPAGAAAACSTWSPPRPPGSTTSSCWAR